MICNPITDCFIIFALLVRFISLQQNICSSYDLSCFLQPTTTISVADWHALLSLSVRISCRHKWARNGGLPNEYSSHTIQVMNQKNSIWCETPSRWFSQVALKQIEQKQYLYEWSELKEEVFNQHLDISSSIHRFRLLWRLSFCISIPWMTSHKNQRFTGDSDVANAFNCYFGTVFDELGSFV